MTLDIDIGFRKRPRGLEALLGREGYTVIERKRGYAIYTRPNNDWPRLFYSPKPDKDPQWVQLWENARFHNVSELDINYHHEDFAVMEEANRLARVIVRELDAVAYDAQSDEFFTKEDI